MSDRYDGFTVSLFEDEEGDWVAHFNERPEISAFGASPEEALREIDVVWEGIKQIHLEDGTPIPVAPARKEYSGQFNIRIDRRLHRALAVEAAQASITLNALVSQKLLRATHV
jgi:predicted HicB family RNase H-like nuclease